MKSEIWILASEMTPLAKTGGLGDVMGGLPPALARLGYPVRVFLPAYGAMNREGFSHEGGNLAVPLGPARVPARLLSRTEPSGLRITLIECDEFFARLPLYDDGHREFADNARRFIFFTRAVCELARRSERPPAIVHANDWQTALAPLLLELFPPVGGPPKRVFTIHNLAYQGRFGHWEADWMGLTASQWERAWRADGLEDCGGVNFLKAGVAWADRITTVSPTYAREILQPDQGQGIHELLRSRAGAIHGVLNGADYETWNPATDPYLPRGFDHDSMQHKLENKSALRARLGLPPSHRPLIGMVSRLTWQKGIDLMARGAREMVDRGADLVFLGSGEPSYIRDIESLRAALPHNVAVWIGFSEELAHLMTAGCDAIVMPSRFEPCGLTQLYAMRYGTLPIVHRTGGLVDTVSDLGDEGGTGFTFVGLADERPLVEAVSRAVSVFNDEPELWRAAQQRAMAQRFTWEDAARHYGRLYEGLLS
ncbi:MAG: glycogen synthase GlgA [Chrysiogenetes bacterium]|nr:glycogen synthase GlgA [Chrysiogenetes bacterium]